MSGVWMSMRLGSFSAVAPAIVTFFITHSIMQAAQYQTRLEQQDGIQVVRLSDTRNQVEVLVVPSIGNMAFSIKVKGHEILYLPARTLFDLQANPKLGGVPFLAPWANRIDGMSYWANGKRYLLNNEIGTLRLDGNGLPIHGLLAFSPLWEVSGSHADEGGAEVTSKLEFWKYPDLMAQFPFAHAITMRYRLHDGVIDVETTLHNLSAAPMPVAIGFHPYFQLDDLPRDEWTARIPARSHLVLNDKVVPTGQKEPVGFGDPFPLRGNKLDDGFVDLVRNDSGRAEFSVRGKQQQITMSYGPKYTVAVAYAPAGQSFICFEPMTALTNGWNLAHEGKWDGLQSVPPGGEWRETFQIRAEGF